MLAVFRTGQRTDRICLTVVDVDLVRFLIVEDTIAAVELIVIQDDRTVGGPVFVRFDAVHDAVAEVPGIQRAPSPGETVKGRIVAASDLLRIADHPSVRIRRLAVLDRRIDRERFRTCVHEQIEREAPDDPETEFAGAVFRVDVRIADVDPPVANENGIRKTQTRHDRVHFAGRFAVFHFHAKDAGRIFPGRIAGEKLVIRNIQISVRTKIEPHRSHFSRFGMRFVLHEDLETVRSRFVENAQERGILTRAVRIRRSEVRNVQEDTASRLFDRHTVRDRAGIRKRDVKRRRVGRIRRDVHFMHGRK